MSDHYLGSSPAAHSLCVVPDSLFIDHVAMTKERISKLAPAVLKIVVDHLAPHTLSLIGDLAHHAAR
jgi:hypothetical protein